MFTYTEWKLREKALTSVSVILRPWQSLWLLSDSVTVKKQSSSAIYTGAIQLNSHSLYLINFYNVEYNLIGKINKF